MIDELRKDAAATAERLRKTQPDWPCQRGCDDCCRHLARPMELVPDEWRDVEAGLQLLQEDQGQAVIARIERGPDTVCPFLADGACLIYEHRPLACRTYGFYVDRDQGLYCRRILVRVEDGSLAGVVWGNQAAVDEKLDRLGPRMSMRAWFDKLFQRGRRR